MWNINKTKTTPLIKSVLGARSRCSDSRHITNTQSFIMLTTAPTPPSLPGNVICLHSKHDLWYESRLVQRAFLQITTTLLFILTGIYQRQPLWVTVSSWWSRGFFYSHKYCIWNDWASWNNVYSVSRLRLLTLVHLSYSYLNCILKYTYLKRHKTSLIDNVFFISSLNSTNANSANSSI